MIAESKKKKKDRYKETLFSILIMLLFIALIVFLILSNARINKKRDQYASRIESLKEEIRILEEKNKGLRENVSNAESEERLEEIAREQLGMKAPGEEVVVVSREEGEKQEEVKEKKGFFSIIWDWFLGR